MNKAIMKLTGLEWISGNLANYLSFLVTPPILDKWHGGEHFARGRLAWQRGTPSSWLQGEMVHMTLVFLASRCHNNTRCCAFI
jgi:hypothetical protein